MTRLLWYAGASLGPIVASGAQFLLSIWILHSVTPESFGSFSFLLIVLQLTFGFSSALLCAPYPILFLDRSRAASDTEAMFLSTSLAASIAIGVGLTGLALSLGIPLQGALLFGGYAIFMQVRWFARAMAYVRGEQWRTVTSDTSYGVALVGIAFALGGPHLPLEGAILSMLLAAVLGVAAFGGSYLKKQFLGFSLGHIKGYREVWDRHSRWSLLGVITTEATANAHAYIVTLLAGPAAFAPIAASSLLFRPVQLAQSALTDYERPMIARDLRAEPGRAPRPALGLFRFALFVVWVGSIIGALALLIWWPTLVFPKTYTGQNFPLAVVLWALISGVRVSRTPESTLLQAAGEFKSLANITAFTAIFSVAIVTILLLLFGPVFSLGGILIGEVLVMFALFRLVHKIMDTRVGFT